MVGQQDWIISFLWSWSYWSSFLLTWAVAPLLQEYEDAGDFTVTERLKTSIQQNLLFYLIVGLIGLIGLILLIAMHKNLRGGAIGFAMACSNTFGLVTGAFLLGFGLSEIPRSLWKMADWNFRQKALSHKIAKMAMNLDDAHQNFSNAILVAQATSNQMSKRDPLRTYMDVIDKMLAQMFKEDPSFKPQGGKLGENDMDYDNDEKSMAVLRRNLRVAQEQYYRYKRKYVSSLRGSRPGALGSIFDTAEFLWRCILKKQLQKLLAIILGCMSVAILLAEATLLLSVDLSLLSLLIKSVRRQKLFVQVFAFIPLMYMCICTYYSLFKIGMLALYSLMPRQTSSVSLLMFVSMVARFAPPISYNFLNLIRLDKNAKTIFEKQMGTIDEAVPFFGTGFNTIYPLIMVIYKILVASNFFIRVIGFFGGWKLLDFQSEADDMDGFDPSGIIILQRDRLWLEQGHKVGEQVIPLARNFSNINLDEDEVEATISSPKDAREGRLSRAEIHQNSENRDSFSLKYGAIREQTRRTSSPRPSENTVTSTDASILNSGSPNTSASLKGAQSSRLSSTWQTMKTGFQSFKTKMGSRKFVPLKKTQEMKHFSYENPSSESLDEIFQRLKRPLEDVAFSDDEMMISGSRICALEDNIMVPG